MAEVQVKPLSVLEYSVMHAAQGPKSYQEDRLRGMKRYCI